MEVQRTLNSFKKKLMIFLFQCIRGSAVMHLHEFTVDIDTI